MKITRFGHAAVLISTDETNILIDPGTYSSDSAFELTGLDAIILTHQHPDHVDLQRLPSLLAANPTATLVAEPETIPATGLTAWSPLSADDELQVGSLSITAVGGRHATIHPAMGCVGNIGVLARDSNGTSVFHPGDSYAVTPKDVDILTVPLSAPWAKLEETIDFVDAIRPKLVVPIHDRALTDVGYPIYWESVARLGGAGDAMRLAPDGAVDA